MLIELCMLNYDMSKLNNPDSSKKEKLTIKIIFDYLVVFVGY